MSVNSEAPEGAICFHTADAKEGDPPIIQLGPADEIYVRGKLIEHDKELVEAMRAFVSQTLDNYMSQTAKHQIMVSRPAVPARELKDDGK